MRGEPLSVDQELVAVRVPVVADAAVAVEGVSGGDRRRLTWEEQSGAGEQGAVEEVAAGDRLAQAEPVLVHSSSTVPSPPARRASARTTPPPPYRRSGCPRPSESSGSPPAR